MEYDKTLKPLIPTTRSCNSLMRKIKYNLYDDDNEDVSYKNNCVPNIQLHQEIDDDNMHNMINQGKISECHQFQFEENVSDFENNFMKKTISHSNLFNNKVINENKQNENEQTVRVLKTVFINGELCPINVKQQSNENEMHVSMNKSNSSEKLSVINNNEDLHTFDTLSSNNNNNNRLECNVDISSHNDHNSEYSYVSTKGSKRIQPISFNENEASKRSCTTKSKHETILINGHHNHNIDSDCQYPKHENINCSILDKDNSLLEHSTSSLDIDGVSQLLNESSVRENKWVKSPYPKLSVKSSLSLRQAPSNFLDVAKDEKVDSDISSVIELNNQDHDGRISPSSDIQWPLKMSPCDPDSPESKPIINNSEPMETDHTSSDNECNNSPKTEHVLSLRNSEEIISKLVSSRRSINENENTQIYALPMDQKLSHMEHAYVENAINSSTRDLEVVNVLSPVSINSTDIPINKSSWVPDISLVHAHNNDDGDHSQSSSQNLNGMCNSINLNPSRVSNHHHHHQNDVEHLNHMQLETSILPRSCSYNRIEPRIYSDDPFIAVLSPSESSVSNSAYSSAYDLNRIPMTVPVNNKSISVTASSKDGLNELNNLNSNIYHANTSNLIKRFKNKSTMELPSYSFAMNKTRATDISTIKRGSPNDELDEDSDDVFSDNLVTMDLSINSTTEPEPNILNDTSLYLNNLSMSGLISDFKSVNALNSFDKSGNWSTIKNPSDTTNILPKQNLKIYTDPTELISGPVNLNTHSGIPMNLNEVRTPKVFLGNKSPSQVYYSPIANFCVSSDNIDMKNHVNLDDSKQNNLKNRPSKRDCMNTCSNNKYMHTALQSTDNDSNVKQTLISGYDNIHNQNNGLIYKFPRSDSNLSSRYENPIQLQSKNSDCLSPLNGLSYTNFDQILGSNLLDDTSKKEEQNVINMAQLMLQSNKNCKVHYKWPLNKNKSQSVSKGKVSETSQCLDYKKNSNVLYKYQDNESNQTRLQNMSPNEMVNPNSGLAFSERKNDSVSFQSNQQFQDISNLITSDLSPTTQSGSDSTEEIKQTQSRSISNFENSSRNELIDQETMYRNAATSSQSQESSTTLSREVFEAARFLFNKGKLFLCMCPKCTNNHHFRVIPSNAEMLRHEFTVPFDDFRFNIQYKYKQLLTSNPRTWPSIPELVQLTKRCLCEICGDFDSKLNQNQLMLHTYVEGKKPNIEEDNNENEHPTDPQIRLSWKKNLANRFSTEAVAKQTITQMIEDMQRHIQRFTRAFSIIFPLSNDVKINSQNLQNACESYLDVNNSDKFNSECVKRLDIAHKCFNKDLHLYSYQYLQIPKVISKYVLEELSNSSYQPPNQNVLNTSHQFDEEHLPNEINRYFVKNSNPSSQSVNSNLTTNQSLKYIHENIPNTSQQTVVDTPSTSRQSVGNITGSSHQPILNNFPTTSHAISLDSCSLNDRSQKHSHLPRYYPDGQQMYTEFSHTYLQVPSTQFPNSSTNSYYGSPVNMPSDNSVPFCSPSLSVNSVPNSPSSDCSIPSLVETVATAVPEHTLLDDSLEAVNAAHNLMLISNRHRYNSTTSITTTNTTDTVTTTATTNNMIVSKSNAFSTDSKNKHISPTDATTINNISQHNPSINNSSTFEITNTLPLSVTESEDQEMNTVHNRRKKKKKHDKKKDKKKKGKR